MLAAGHEIFARSVTVTDHGLALMEAPQTSLPGSALLLPRNFGHGS